MKVYVITSGTYSDYHICAVATDIERAEKLAMLYTDNCDEASIEEYDTEDDTEALQALDFSRLPFRVKFDVLGEVQDVGRYGFDHFEPKTYWSLAPTLGNLDKTRLIVMLYAPDEEAAVKIAAEKRAEFLARVGGLT